MPPHFLHRAQPQPLAITAFYMVLRFLRPPMAYLSPPYLLRTLTVLVYRRPYLMLYKI